MKHDLGELGIIIKNDENGNHIALLKPQYAIDGERVIRLDAKSASAGKWVTMNGAKVLIKGGKFVNGPFAGRSADAGARYFSPASGKVSAKDRATIATACADADKNGSSTIWMDNYKIELKKASNYPKEADMVVKANGIIQGTGNGKRNFTLTKHPISEVGDRLAELRNIVKPKTMSVQTGGKAE